jgi:hypothetical protein
MSEGQRQSRWVVGGGAMVLLIIAVPLWNEFRVPGNLAWNTFLALFLVGLAVAAILLQRYFWQHPLEVGEARFDTTKRNGES